MLKVAVEIGICAGSADHALLTPQYFERHV
jgi:hypothetical protein